MRTTLENSYCIPKTEADFDALGDRSMWCLNNGVAYGPIPYFDQNTNGNIEIPVSRFADLLHDRIAPWRLVEIGFKYDHIKFELTCQNGIIQVRFWNGTPWCNIYPSITMVGISMNITTFTELLTLIRFLTPPTK